MEQFWPTHICRIVVILTIPLQSLHFILLKTFEGGTAAVSWIVDLLQNSSGLQFEAANRIFGRQMNSWFHFFNKQPSGDHSTTIFDCFCEVLFVKWNVTLKAGARVHTYNKYTLIFVFWSSKYFPKVFGKMFLGKIEKIP